MTNSEQDAGLISVLMDRFEKQRLPRALSLKEKVDRGEKLDDYDLVFLEEVFADSSKIKPLLDRHPEYQPLAARMAHLYKEITEKGLKNQNSTG